MSAASLRAISVFVMGRVFAADLEALGASFHPVEVVELNLDPAAPLGKHQSTLRSAVNAAASDWILLLRSGERIAGEVAGELADAAADPPRAWGFRIRVQRLYCGRPLRLGDEREGEIRLFHRRHARFDPRDRGEMNIEGAVIRLGGDLVRPTFESAAEHRAALSQRGVPHSLVRRILLFARATVANGALWKGRTSLRYLWIEAGWDKDSHSGRSF